MLPGIVQASYAMPDAHWGYGFPIGGVAAFDAERRRRGVGRRRRLRHLLRRAHPAHRVCSRRRHRAVQKHAGRCAVRNIPAGLGSTGDDPPERREMDAMLRGRRRWAVQQGYGSEADLERIEERGRMAGAKPEQVSDQAKKRQRDEMGTLGVGNHYLEVQEVAEVFDADSGRRLRPAPGRRRGQHPLRLARPRPPDRHRVPQRMAIAAAQLRHHAAGPRAGLRADRFAHRRRTTSAPCAPASTARWPTARSSPTWRARSSRAVLPGGTADAAVRRVAQHLQGRDAHRRWPAHAQLYVHRKGATRAFGPGHPDLPAALRAAGQPVLIGGTMGTALLRPGRHRHRRGPVLRAPPATAPGAP